MKTRSIACEKLTRNGRARASGSRWMIDESFRTSAPPAGTALARAARSAGAITAMAEVSLPGSELNRIDRKIATPRVPPIWRKKVADEVPTPMSRGETAFWMASTSGCRLLPSPRPKISMTTPVCHSGVSAPTRLNRINPISISEVPMIGKIL